MSGILSLFGCTPYSSNLFYVLECEGIFIPKDFYDKYITKEEHDSGKWLRNCKWAYLPTLKKHFSKDVSWIIYMLI